MVVMPIQSALAVSFASKEMIGRYMAVFGFVWMFPAIFGPYLAGLVFDNLNPNMLWYGSIVLTGIAMVSYVMMNQSVGKESRFEALIEK
jgi:MFS family permease